jgi:hypothetical protein
MANVPIIDNWIIKPIEGTMGMLPYGNTPVGRMVWAGGAGTAFAYVVRPKISFYEATAPGPGGGLWLPKKWSLTAPVGTPSNELTIFPAWAWTVLPALMFGVFV